jgi:Inner membrane protein YgaP-like, transmembrane domain
VNAAPLDEFQLPAEIAIPQQIEIGGNIMTLERYLRLIAGAFVVISLALGYWVSPYWYLFTAFVGLNLFQSAFTNWCPMMAILRKAGVAA